MKNKKFFFIFGVGIILAGIAAIVFFWMQPLYGPKDIVTAEILTSHQWHVEGNGEYNYIAFDDTEQVRVFIYPDFIGNGQWRFDDGVVRIIAEDAQFYNRVYSQFRFDSDGVLHVMTDGNEERWRIADTNI